MSVSYTHLVSGGILGGIRGGIRFNSPSKTAKSWQGKDDYPGIDDYVDVNMHKGDIPVSYTHLVMDEIIAELAKIGANLR